MDKNTHVYTVVHVSELGELDNGQREFNDKLNECTKFLENKYYADIEDVKFNVNPVFYPGNSTPIFIYTALVVYAIRRRML